MTDFKLGTSRDLVVDAYSLFIKKLETRYKPINQLIEERKREEKALWKELKDNASTMTLEKLEDLFSKMHRWALHSQAIIHKLKNNDMDEVRKLLTDFTIKNILTPPDFDKLKTLYGFGIGAASAFFTLKNPNEFTVYGYAVIKGIRKLDLKMDMGDDGESYFKINEILIEFAKTFEIPLALLDWFLADIGLTKDITNYKLDDANILIWSDDVKDAFKKTQPRDYEGKPGYDPYHMIVIDNEEKPVKAVFRNIKRIPHDHDFTTHMAERVLENLRFKLVNKKEDGTIGRFQVFLAPRSNETSYENFKSTIEYGVPYERVEPHLDEEGKEILKGQDKILVWGNLPGKKASWESMNKGDYVFFYVKGEFPYVGRLLYKIHSEDLGLALWPPKPGSEPWSYVFFLENLQKLDPSIPVEEFRRLAEYKDNWIVQGFQPLHEKGLNALYSQYDSIDEFIKQHIHGDSAPVVPLDYNKINMQLSDFENLPIFHEKINNVKKMLCAAINSGKHIMLLGPPGTGKTEIAKYIGEIAEDVRHIYCNGYVLTTATSDWTTFDTIGGLIPQSGGNHVLGFSRGKFLDAIAENKFLIIDEINRADIDKAFGQLFTVLSGQSVELQFKEDGYTVTIIRDKKRVASGYNDGTYTVGNNWRIIATMNTFDKTSLYEMSYAFMRRFAFIHVGVPENKDIMEKLIKQFDTENKLEMHHIEKLLNLWLQINAHRKIGPAIIKDVVEHFTQTDLKGESLTDTIIAYILPQFEGMEQHDLVTLFSKISDLLEGDENIASIRNMFSEMFEIDVNDLK